MHRAFQKDEQLAQMYCHCQLHTLQKVNLSKTMATIHLGFLRPEADDIRNFSTHLHRLFPASGGRIRGQCLYENIVCNSKFIFLLLLGQNSCSKLLDDILDLKAIEKNRLVVN